MPTRRRPTSACAQLCRVADCDAAAAG